MKYFKTKCTTNIHRIQYTINTFKCLMYVRVFSARRGLLYCAHTNMKKEIRHTTVHKFITTELPPDS